MRIPRVYSASPITPNAEMTLGADLAHYLGKVLRMAPGRPLILFDGRGGEYSAEILSIAKQAITVLVGDFDDVSRESPLAIDLAIGVSRGERFDWVLQKATELGVGAIFPLMTERVEVKLTGDRLAKKMAHWQQIVISACEQSQRTCVPQVHAPQGLSQWLAARPEGLGFVLHHRSAQSLADYPGSTDSVSLLVGPEGGLTDEEIQLAQAKGFNALQLGPRVLRTETAPIAALSLLQNRWGDMG